MDIEYRYHPCKLEPIDNDGLLKDVVRCSEEKAEFWGLYYIDEDGLEWHICDVVSERDCLNLLDHLSLH